MAEIRYELRERDLTAFNDHQLKSSEPFQKTLRRHQASIPAFLVVIALFIWFYYQDTLTAVWTGTGAVAWGFLAPLYIKWNHRRKILKLYSEEDKARILGNYTLRTEPEALVEVSEAGEERIHWEDVLRIEPARNYAFIFVSLDSAVIIPRATVSSGDIVEFFEAVEQHIQKAS